MADQPDRKDDEHAGHEPGRDSSRPGKSGMHGGHGPASADRVGEYRSSFETGEHDRFCRRGWPAACNRRAVQSVSLGERKQRREKLQKIAVIDRFDEMGIKPRFPGVAPIVFLAPAR